MDVHGYLTQRQGRRDGAPARLAAPNFFILGAGKCGTTSLYHALAQHPQIHMSPVKEPSFFSAGFQVISNPVDYFNLFPAQPGKTRYGEASHVYFSAPETPPILAQLFPAAKFLVILRDPVDRAYSLHQHMHRSGHEPIGNFERALRMEDVRFKDDMFRRNCPQYFWNYMYRRSSRFDLQLERYLDLFQREQFMVLTLGELRTEPELWLERIFTFLDVDPSVKVDATPQNQPHRPYPPMAPAVRQALTNHFAGVRERVEAMAGRGMTGW